MDEDEWGEVRDIAREVCDNLAAVGTARALSKYAPVVKRMVPVASSPEYRWVFKAMKQAYVDGFLEFASSIVGQDPEVMGTMEPFFKLLKAARASTGRT